MCRINRPNPTVNDANVNNADTSVPAAIDVSINQFSVNNVKAINAKPAPNLAALLIVSTYGDRYPVAVVKPEPFVTGRLNGYAVATFVNDLDPVPPSAKTNLVAYVYVFNIYLLGRRIETFERVACFRFGLF